MWLRFLYFVYKSDHSTCFTVQLIGRLVFVTLIITTLSSAGIPVLAQERCGTVEYTAKLKRQGLIPADDKTFENWIQQQTLKRQTSRNQRTQSTYQVPVVFHIIHNGEIVDSGTNVSDAQILSQLKVLNEDFNRLNPDAGDTPAEFADDAGVMDIEFVLAKQTPEGLTTSGILRKQGPKTEWSMNDNYQLKALSYWPAEDYLNIWVCNLTDFLGYAQHPESNLPGHENSSTNGLTDGVVIWYRSFGSTNDGPFNLDPDYSKGRTATHEIGHFFGLKHIWGDDGSSCSGTDYVEDTPNQAGSSAGCPSHPKTTCTVHTMFQNFLDYTDDDCMNLFTQGQVARMITVLENSPRRATLLTSPGLSDPVPVPNDLGIREILSPLPTACGSAVNPTIEVRNYGSNSVTSAQVSVTIDGVVEETKTVTLGLAALQSAQITFAGKTLSQGSHSISFQILQTNGVTDMALQNNVLMLDFLIPEFDTAPFAVNFNTMPPKWAIQNPDLQYTWQIATANKDTPANKALLMNFFDYEDSNGELDIFLSPVLDLSSVALASLSFDVAHARFQNSNDRLKVIVLKDCESILTGTVVYDKSGAALSTAPSTGNPFVPSGESQWRRELINISQFVNETHIQLAFVGVNDWGNNLYIDNVSLLTSALEDMALKEIKSPSLVTCDDSPSPIVLVQNLGTVTISEFTVEYSVNAAPLQTFQINGITLDPGIEMEVTLPQINLVEGVNTIAVDITNPNNEPDETPANNQREFIAVVNEATDLIPYRENFDGDFSAAWTTVNPTGGMDWQTTATNFNTSIFFNAHSNTDIGDEAWLVSPVLDFSAATEASVVFDISHKTRLGREEVLRILVSSDCGNTYEEVDVFLSPGEFSPPWVPRTEDDWEKNVAVNLNNFVGQQQVRIAFAVTNENGNNLFLDNIEFFSTDNPNLNVVPDIFSIYGYHADMTGSDMKITFNLPQRQQVHYAVIDAMGKTHAEAVLPDILNQTYPLGLEENLPPGVYVIRLKIGDRYFSTRVLIGD